METILPDQPAATADGHLNTCKRLVRRVIEEAVNGGDLGVIDELLAPDVHGALPGLESDADARDLLGVYREAVPDAHWRIEGQFAEGDMVVTNVVATGTQRGPLWGLPATGKRMAVTGTLFCRCREGRITEHRLQVDLLELLQQLGVMPDLTLQHEVIVARLLRDSRRASQVSE